MGAEIIMDGKRIIFNGGQLLAGSPKNDAEAKEWIEELNRQVASKFGENAGMQWGFDCGYKLDFDGPILSISSRFYPPAKYYGPKWDGTITIYFLGRQVKEHAFEAESLTELSVLAMDWLENEVNKVKDFLEK